MNKNEGIKRSVYGILSLVSLALLISPVDLLTGVQVDDIGYALTTLIAAYLNYRASIEDKTKYTEV